MSLLSAVLQVSLPLGQIPNGKQSPPSTSTQHHGGRGDYLEIFPKAWLLGSKVAVECDTSVGPFSFFTLKKLPNFPMKIQPMRAEYALVSAISL